MTQYICAVYLPNPKQLIISSISQLKSVISMTKSTTLYLNSDHTNFLITLLTHNDPRQHICNNPVFPLSLSAIEFTRTGRFLIYSRPHTSALISYAVEANNVYAGDGLGRPGFFRLAYLRPGIDSFSTDIYG